MKIVCSTSNKYLHLIPVFCYLFNKYWSSEQEVTIVGYNSPSYKLPSNFTFHSMGCLDPVSEWSTDLRKYFESMPDTHFIFLMEDMFFKRVDTKMVSALYNRVQNENGVDIGRIDLTNDVQKRPHKILSELFVMAEPDTNYRLSTQPSIWNKKFLLQYLTPGQSPWTFEKQEAKNDEWEILGLVTPPVKNNEGVRKHNPHELDLNGFSQEDIDHIKTLI